MIFRKADPISLLLPQQQRPQIGMMGAPTGQASAPMRIGGAGAEGGGGLLSDALGGLRLPGLGGVPRETPALPWLAAPDGGTAAVAGLPAPTMTPAGPRAPVMTAPRVASATPSRGGSSATPVASERGMLVYNGLLARGFNPAQAAALAGNIQQESSFDPTRPNVGEGGIGLIQWRLDRRKALESFAASTGRSPTALDTQLDFFKHEMGGTEARSASRFLGAQDVETANRALRPYIRYGDDSEATRLDYARRFPTAATAAPAPPPVVAEASPGSGVSRFGLNAGQPVPMNPDGTAPNVVPADITNPPMGPPPPTDIRPDPQKMSLIDLLSSYLPEQGIA